MIDLDQLIALPSKSETWTFTCWTEGDLRAVRVAAWNAAIEAAAKECERCHNDHLDCTDAAESIRAMRIEPEQK